MVGGFADLDRFKLYNDRFGHLAGDTALVALADLLKRQIRSRDLVGRFGGEEFCLFLPDTTSTEAVEIAERLRAAVERLRMPDTDEPITISLGVASVDPAHGQAELVDAISEADKALYDAKHTGRNAIVSVVAPRVAPFTQNSAPTQNGTATRPASRHPR